MFSFLAKPSSLLSSSSSKKQYSPVSADDSSPVSDSIDEKARSASATRTWPTYTRAAVILFVVLITAGLGVTVFVSSLASPHAEDRHPDDASSQSHTHDESNAEQVSTSATNDVHGSEGACTEPYYRREWRSLSEVEKKDYIDAFQCLVDSPSTIGLNGSLYDDLSWVHNLVAHSTHTKAPFLTWHRRFIFVYEKYLRESCDYKGALPFWNWSLDWEDLPSSPIFRSDLGFGSDGDINAPKHGTAHCVTDMPFKNLTPQWHGEKFEPHCLTRWFSEDWFGHYLNPEALEGVLAKTTYAEFFLALEMGPHDIIPMGVRGDFTSFTAPNDPVFYLHHAQLDRVWWLWQMRDKANRVHDYDGEGDNGKNVTLSDVLPLAGLAEDVTVVDIMDTERGEMCYRYS